MAPREIEVVSARRLPDLGGFLTRTKVVNDLLKLSIDVSGGVPAVPSHREKRVRSVDVGPRTPSFNEDEEDAAAACVFFWAERALVLRSFTGPSPVNSFQRPSETPSTAPSCTLMAV